MFWESFFMFGFLVTILSTVYFYFELKNTREKYRKEQKNKARELFELTILSDLSEKIGYSLSSRDIASTIAVTVEKIFQVTSVSYAIVEVDHVELVTTTHEKVGSKYIRGVNDLVIQGMYGIDETLKKLPVIEKEKGVHVDPQGDALVNNLIELDTKPLSYFNIPLVLNNRFTGIISITSKYPSAYQEEDMSMMYKIVNKAQLAIGRLEYVIETEKGKVESLVKSLTSGEIFFTLENGNLNLATINHAALRFLKLAGENPQLIQVLSSFKLKPNLITEMKDVILQKKSTIYRDVDLNGLRFNIYVTPVFSYKSDRIIGVAVTMQDVLREHEIRKMREAFTNMMIHELRAPLTAIKGAADLLMQSETKEEDRVKMRVIIKNASERLLEDIDDMLDSAKIEAGKLQIQKASANINDVIRKATEELSYAASSRAILLENHLDDSIPNLIIDPLRIGQVIVNLLSNAIKFSEEHTIVEVYTRQNEDMIEVEVKDHGSGIESAKIESLFRPFVQADFHNRSKGTGLGLYISKAIVSEHDGKIWLSSKVGEGTSVFFALPIHPKEHLLQAPQATMAN